MTNTMTFRVNITIEVDPLVWAYNNGLDKITAKETRAAVRRDITSHIAHLIMDSALLEDNDVIVTCDGLTNRTETTPEPSPQPPVLVATLDHLNARSLTDQSTITICTHTYPIPPRTRNGLRIGSARVAQVLTAAGYRPALGGIRESMLDDTTIQVEHASTGTPILAVLPDGEYLRIVDDQAEAVEIDPRATEALSLSCDDGDVLVTADGDVFRRDTTGVMSQQCQQQCTFPAHADTVTNAIRSGTTPQEIDHHAYEVIDPYALDSDQHHETILACRPCLARRYDDI
jgi:hypothetical protein